MVLGIILLLLFILYFALSAYLFEMVCARHANLRLMPKPKDQEALSPWAQYDDVIDEGIAWFQAQQVREVAITARDGLRLRGRYLPCGDSDHTVLLVHGYRSASPEHDFACALRLYHEMGFNLLLIDQRAQGKSQGEYMTFGVLEREDVAAWARYLDRSYHPKAVILDGMSMGAATVLMALALPLPPCVKGVVADCGYTTPQAIIHYVMSAQYHMPARLLLPGLKLLFRLRTGHSLTEASAPRAIAASNLPILLIHGEEDQYVPCRMGVENAQASPRTTLVTVPGAGHGVSFLVGREKCMKALDNFVGRVIQ